MSIADRVPGEARGVLRAPGYAFRQTEPPLRLSWRSARMVSVEGVNAEGERREIVLHAVTTLNVPKGRLSLLHSGSPQNQAEKDWIVSYTQGIRRDLNAALLHAFSILRWRATPMVEPANRQSHK